MGNVCGLNFSVRKPMEVLFAKAEKLLYTNGIMSYSQVVKDFILTLLVLDWYSVAH